MQISNSIREVTCFQKIEILSLWLYIACAIAPPYVGAANIIFNVQGLRKAQEVNNTSDISQYYKLLWLCLQLIEGEHPPTPPYFCSIIVINSLCCTKVRVFYFLFQNKTLLSLEKIRVTSNLWFMSKSKCFCWQV